LQPAADDVVTKTTMDRRKRNSYRAAANSCRPVRQIDLKPQFDYIWSAGADLDSTGLVKSELRAEVPYLVNPRENSQVPTINWRWLRK
jgi:hypothetical protein